MKNNMSNIDRGIRIIIAVIVAVLYFTGNISGIVAILLGIIAIAFIVTGLIGFCPLYLPCKFSTKKE